MGAAARADAQRVEARGVDLRKIGPQVIDEVSFLPQGDLSETARRLRVGAQGDLADNVASQKRSGFDPQRVEADEIVEGPAFERNPQLQIRTAAQVERQARLGEGHGPESPVLVVVPDGGAQAGARLQGDDR